MVNNAESDYNDLNWSLQISFIYFLPKSLRLQYMSRVHELAPLTQWVVGWNSFTIHIWSKRNQKYDLSISTDVTNWHCYNKPEFKTNQLYQPIISTLTEKSCYPLPEAKNLLCNTENCFVWRCVMLSYLPRFVSISSVDANLTSKILN